MSERVRLDSWLWAARFFKTRSLAAAAVDGGRVDVNGEPARRSRPVRPGDRVEFRIGPHHYRVTVLALADRRGPASAAALLYEEDPAARAAREARAAQIRRAAPTFFDGAGRPTKKQRREIDRWKGRR